MADTEIRTWNLADADIPGAIAKLEKINARAAKNGLGGRFSWKLGEEKHTPVWLNDDRRTGKPDYYLAERELHVSGDAPKFAGWTFQALLTWDEGVLVTRCTPGFEGRIDDSQIRQGACDHCHADRDRRDCYLLASDDGRQVQVGSSCVRDFLGQDFRPSWITYGSTLDELEDGCRQTVTVSAPAVDVLTWAASVCSQTGWISRAKADVEYRTASGDVLRSCLFPYKAADEETRRAYQPGPEHTAEAQKVLAWAREIDPSTDSEYLANVGRVARGEWVGERNVAILGSAVASYHREMNAKAEREAAPVSEWFGQPKDKVELQVTVKSDTPVAGDYGVRHRYAFVTPEGNSVIWWASSDQALKVGDEIALRGSIKQHETWKDVKSTVLTRCKVQEIQPEPEIEVG